MGQAKRDDNFVPVGLGFDSDNTTPLQLRVDASTNRLLLDITVVTNSGTVAISSKRDDNYVPVSLGAADDGTLTAIPLIVDNRNNLLYVDVLTEP